MTSSARGPGRGRRGLGWTVIGLAIWAGVSWAAAEGFRLSDQESELYYRLLAAAGERIEIQTGAELTGDLHSNGAFALHRDAVVTGDVAVVGPVELRGTVDGELAEGAAPAVLPLLEDEAALRALADRVFEGDTTFTDEVIDDVVFVAGTARVRGDVNGEGTLIATEDVRVDTTGAAAGQGGGKGGGGEGAGEGDSFTLDERTRLSLIAGNDVRIGKDRPFRGALRAGRDVLIETGVVFEGVLFADREVLVKKDARLTFVDFDQVPPELVPLAPVPGSFVTVATPEVAVGYSDDFSGLRLDSLRLLLDGEEVSAPITVEPERASFTPEAPLAEGEHSVAASIEDRSDNLGETSWSFVVDTVPPQLAVTAPEAGATLFNTVPPVTVTFSDATSGVDTATLEVTLDGTPLACDVSGTGASCPVGEVAEGDHEIVAAVFDVAGNRGTASAGFELVLDLEPPVIAVDSPADGAIVGEASVTVVGTVRDDESGVASVSVNGQEASLAGDGFSVPVELAPGENTIVVSATDRVGNSASVILTVTRQSDTTPPELRITAPQPGVFVTESRPALDVSFRDGDTGVDTATLAFTANGAELAVDCNLGVLGGRCFPTADLPEGPLELGVSVADRAGNVAGAAVSFIVDTAGLEVTVTAPEDGSVTGEEQVDVFGAVSVPVDSVEVNGVAAAVSGLGFSARVPLREGVNMIVALATKPNGRTATGSIEVTRDAVAPIVRIESPADGSVSITREVPVVGLVNDIVGGGAPPEVTVNGVPAPVSGGGFMLASLELVPGPNVVEAVATDAVGNSSRHAVTVTFEPPVGVRIGFGPGNAQTGTVDRPLAEPLVAEVRDDLGNPVAGRLVRFEVTRNNGVLRTGPDAAPERVVQVPTDGAGRAAVLLTLGDTAGEGNNRVRASAVGVAGEVEFCASALPAPPDKILMVEGDNQRGAVGDPLPQPLEALVVDVEGNPLAGVPVTFRVVRGSGQLDGRAELERVTDGKGVARTVLTLGRDPGVNNNVVSATVDGLEGLPATFSASGLEPGDPAATRLSGVVLDSAQTPIPGAVVSIESTALAATTDAEGRFEISGVPVGHVVVDVDPTSSPRPEEFPPLAFETVTVAGQDNTLGQPILIPALDIAGSQVVGGARDVTLEMADVEGLTLTVFAGSVTFPDGSREGSLTISQVHLDKVPMPPPSGTIFMPPAWTIQPAGVRFDPPARITIPNDGLPPGRVIDIFQFDHTLNEFINVGKGEVSQDAFVITSLPGFGITRAGWGGCGQPQPPPTCTCNCDDGNKCTRDRCSGQPNCRCSHDPLTNFQCCDGKMFDPAKQGCCDGKIYNLETQCCDDGDVRQKKPIASFFQVLTCDRKTANEMWKREFDGCSLPASPGFDKDNPAGGSDTQFGDPGGSRTRPCDLHDICYQTCYPGGLLALSSARRSCDVAMWRNMRDVCSRSQEGLLTRARCFFFADRYYEGLRVGGTIPFNNRQKQVCKCCP